MYPALAHGCRGRGGGNGGPSARFPGPPGHCPAPRGPRRSPHGFQRFAIRRRKKKKKRKKSCQRGKIFSSCSCNLAGEAAEKTGRAVGSRPGTGTQSPVPLSPRSAPGRPPPGPGLNPTPSSACSPCRRAPPPRFGHIPPPKPPTLPGGAFATGPRAQRRRRARKAPQCPVASLQDAP